MMITCTAFEVYPQLLQQLVQFSSIFGRGRLLHKQAPGRRSGSNGPGTGGPSLEHVLCPESFHEALKSTAELLNGKDIDVTALADAVKQLRIFDVRPVNNTDFYKRQTTPNLPWMVRHRSSWSFETNKILENSSRSRSSNLQQHRTFKTRHSGAGIGKISSTSAQEFEDALSDNSIFSLPKKLKLAKALTHKSNELNELLNDEPQRQKLKIKLAFAEGYRHAQPIATPKLKLFHLVRDVVFFILILVILFSFMGDMAGGPFKRILIGNQNEVHPEEIDVTFSDVKGVEEAKQELQEVVEFLKNPEKFSVLGGKLPKGVLLVGPPGTGKTLLARAVAGEAGVPFFHAAGPEFDEILVGQGARRVRDLFSTAKLRAPCVIFIDEIDSVGAKRTSSVLHPYANQTINQLLTEMDGFRQNEGVIVLGATNRRDDLDRALLRPGRFDVEVQVPVPDLNGRKEIFDLYLDKIKATGDVTSEVCARRTTGFTGADIENMVNQAALRAAIDGAAGVDMTYLENARDKLIMGPERKSRIPDEESNTITAYHEAGHTLVSLKTKDAVPLHKVTIVSRGPSLGHTAFIPEKENYHLTKSQMMAQLDSLMGGRVAEELTFGNDKVTTGASNDLQRATQLATTMVKQCGMSEKVGVRYFEEENNGLVTVNELSISTSETIDSEIKRILQDSYERAKIILKTHSKELKMIAEALLRFETLDAEEVKDILEGREVKKR